MGTCGLSGDCPALRHSSLSTAAGCDQMLSHLPQPRLVECHPHQRNVDRVGGLEDRLGRRGKRIVPFRSQVLTY
jgi:hypothetical protein